MAISYVFFLISYVKKNKQKTSKKKVFYLVGLEKNSKRGMKPREKTKKQKLKLGEETPGPAGLKANCLIISV